jgi:hypothetical protein
MINKFPRIPHLSWSPGGTRDDRRLSDFSLINFIGNRIVITEKMDGSNLCITRDEIFARSHSGAPTHPSFDLAKKMHGEIRHKIPQECLFMVSGASQFTASSMIVYQVHIHS